ncbi:uncharacterized protein EI97DRAFT_118358 [Westerdykella ornata]|uniref:Uncharacterized protein n=1 Tax=Westerdykella ornata TaxID=318751 RepID=A0A6A6JUP7_WESOR|nr:uncharacterized protein EI97DRAFT_118358 [Westerdykella ornata]KAF2280302.1 hypothetical protein EI97DRAFT_118358 [Westerdykella ornata]
MMTLREVVLNPPSPSPSPSPNPTHHQRSQRSLQLHLHLPAADADAHVPKSRPRLVARASESHSPSSRPRCSLPSKSSSAVPTLQRFLPTYWLPSTMPTSGGATPTAADLLRQTINQR